MGNEPLDPMVVLRQFLSSNAGLSTATGNRLYAGSKMPSGYTPGTGPAILFSPRGGDVDYTSHVWTAQMQFRCYALSEALASQIAGKLWSALHEKSGRDVLFARQDGMVRTSIEPDTQWSYALAFYWVKVKQRQLTP